LQDLLSHDCVISAHPSGHATWRLVGPKGEEEVQVAGRFSANTAQALRKAAVAGLGIALLPPVLARLDVQAGVLVPVLPHYQPNGYGMNVLYPSRRHLPLAVTAFIGLVIQKMNAADAPEGLSKHPSVA
jgi:DNA-binding transcriptional LysR family regulator